MAILAAAACAIALLAAAVELGLATGLISSAAWQRFLVPPPTPAPPYSPMAGLVYVSPTGRGCVTLRPRPDFSEGWLKLLEDDYTVCDGLQVEILQASWMSGQTPGCYAYLVRVPGTVNLKGWLRQDQLAQDLNVSPTPCPCGD